MHSKLTYDLGARNRLYNSTGFFFLTWAAHYVPFYIMGRQLFLHHYLPAHLASALVTGALVEFVFNIDPVDIDDVASGNATLTKNKKTAVQQNKPVRERTVQSNLLGMWAATGGILAVVVWSFLYFAPLTYGQPGLSIEQVQARKWLNYDLHFAK
jgi:dolichyl-phosphate-mannose-protein mannosyltransferase